MSEKNSQHFHKNCPYAFKHELDCVLLGFAIRSRTDMRSVWTTHTQRVQYVEPQEDHIILTTLYR
jgi:hypothetical protein